MAVVTWWELVLLTVAPTPGLIVWLWLKRRADARVYAETAAYRRAKFAGSIRKPGSVEATPLDRPARESALGPHEGDQTEGP